MILPSRELLSKIFNGNITHIDDKVFPRALVTNRAEYLGDTTNISYGIKIANQNGYTYKEINIYELTHMCKEWALDKVFFIQSGYADQIGWYCSFAVMPEDEPRVINADTESESIFKACEGILQQKDKQ